MISPDFWRGRRVFLTGHTGFKGTWACALLAHLGADVTGFALDPPTSPALFDMANMGSRVRDLRGDVCDAADLAGAMSKASPDIVIHMAAQSLVRASYAAPVETWRVNVMGTLNVLEAARACTPRAVIVVTTDKVYDQRGAGRPFREDDPLGGHDPYASSKTAAEIATASWRDSFLAPSITVASARAGNVIGGGDYAANRIVPDAIRAFQAGEMLEVRNPSAIRPWQHVLEPLAGYLALAERACHDPAYAGAWNFGPGAAHEQDVATLVHEACALWGAGAGWRRDPHTQHAHEAPELRLDAGKARERMAWTCQLGFRETIEWTIGFYRDVARGADAGALMQAQIATYLERVEASECASF
ncbi:MAG: putative CDP-D-glucose-4,6-dehydratase [Hyphomicrobiales bacterium]|nr:putative CDP-D-glucose-4,6-dehydratase [Hyphomicrobiales bacterium]